jgi:hypothetical protein
MHPNTAAGSMEPVTLEPWRAPSSSTEDRMTERDSMSCRHYFLLRGLNNACTRDFVANISLLRQKRRPETRMRMLYLHHASICSILPLHQIKSNQNQPKKSRASVPTNDEIPTEQNYHHDTHLCLPRNKNSLLSSRVGGHKRPIHMHSARTPQLS